MYILCLDVFWIKLEESNVRAIPNLIYSYRANTKAVSTDIILRN